MIMIHDHDDEEQTKSISVRTIRIQVANLLVHHQEESLALSQLSSAHHVHNNIITDIIIVLTHMNYIIIKRVHWVYER